MKMLTYTKQDDVGILKVNRPEALNALNREVLNEMMHFLENKALEDRLKVLILSGEGEKAFIAGADIKEMQSLSQNEIMDFISLGQNVTHLLENAPFATIAAVNGYALGGGLEMALACDFIYASRKAKLGLPEVTLGIIPGFGGTQRLARAVGTRIAKEMILTGKHISAEEAIGMRLINRICEPEELLQTCQETGGRIAKHSGVAIDQGKNAVNDGYPMRLKEALEMEGDRFAVCFMTKEREQAMQAFLNKQKV